MNKPDWTTAPHDAQFYSCRKFRKHEGITEFFWDDVSGWIESSFDKMSVHKDVFGDFEMRPEGVKDEPAWVMWGSNQKDCPVPEGHEVEVEFRDGWGYQSFEPEYWEWMKSECDPKGSDIIAYRDWTEFYESTSEHILQGKGITIEEMPQGAFITAGDKTILIDSTEDANLLVNLLGRMIEASQEVVEWDGEGFPPAGIECEYFRADFNKWVVCTTIGMFRGEMVCVPDGGGFMSGKVENFRLISHLLCSQGTINDVIFDERKVSP